MAASDVTVTGNLTDALGIAYDYTRTKMWLTFNTANNRVTDDEGVVRLDAGAATVNADGSFSLTGIPVPGSSNPTAFQVKIHYDAPPRLPGVRSLKREAGDFGWMTIAADATLAELEDEQAVPPNYQTTFTEAMEAIRDESEANLADQVDLSGISTSDDVVEALVKNTGGAGPKTSAALTASIATLAAPRWKPNTDYVEGQAITNPGDSVVIAKDAHNSGSTYDGSHWNAITDEVADQIAADPSVAAAAADAAEAAVGPAITADLATRAGIPQLVTYYDDTVGWRAIVDATGHKGGLELRRTDGLLTDWAADRTLDRIVERWTVVYRPGVGWGLVDATQHRGWVEVNDTDGGMTKWCIDQVRAALVNTQYLQHVLDSDSFGAATSGGGTNLGAHLSALLGKTVANTSQSGSLASEIAIRAGGICPKIVVTGNQIPADTSTVAVTVTLPDSGPTSDRTFDVKVQGVACTLAYSNTPHTWTLARKVAAAAVTPVPRPAVAIPDVSTKGNDYVHIVLGGRNNNTSRVTAQQPLLDTAAEYRRTGTRFLILSITNRTDEPSGSTAYNDIIAVNDALRAAYPREYVDIRSRLINEGLALAGLTATGTDTTDIANDCIPSSLIAGDSLHPNDSGRTALAAILLNELQIRGLA